MALSEARAALAGCDWSRARDILDATVCSTPTTEGERLDELGEALWWLGRIDDCIDARQRAYALLEEFGPASRAGQVAIWLYEHHCFKGRMAMASGWLRRARRVLESETGRVEWGNLLLREAEEFHGDGDLLAAINASTEALHLGRELQSSDLEAEALQTIGRILVDQGRHREGMGHLDEAMLLAVEGRLGPYATGKVYCSLIGACEDVGDLRRAAEWTEAATRWSDHHPLAVFPGLCRLKRAEVLQRRGDWELAEREARLACEELASVKVSSAAAGWIEVGEIRRRIGDLVGAEEAFAHADELCCTPCSGMALLRLAQGNPKAAAGIIDDALGDAKIPLIRARLLPAKVQICVAAGRLADATDAADELEHIAAQYESDALVASAFSSRGRVQLAVADSSARATLRRAVERWQQLDVPYETASAQLLLGQACRSIDDPAGEEAAFKSAIATFDRLGAAYDARHARQLCEVRTLPGGLSEREAEVLRLVAKGATNKDIARTLDLSDKTIARHLSNIFAKTGAPTRTAATAFAFESGIVSTTI